ncbi:methyltransferase [bacterium]|jgi:hypothetical protein|nr:methyltransferase [bacterium]
MEQVQGILNYLDDMSEKPVNYTFEPPPGTPARTGRTVKHEVTIIDGRTAGFQPSLDVEGFMLTGHRSAVGNFYDENEVKRVYYPEMERLVREILGATRVLVFDHNVRNGSKEARAKYGVREPVRFAHNDYTLKSGPQRVRELCGDAEAERLLRHRYVFINVWRPIRGPVEQSALAVCDARSMTQSDFIATDLVYRDRVGEVYSVRYSPRHRWYYFSRMRPDEVLLLKCFDSDPNRARYTAHSAFEDPATPPGAAPRESIEARTIAFFAPAAS